MKKVILTALLLVFTFSMNAQSWWSNKRVKGNGKVTTESRKVGNYDAVSLAGFFDVVLVRGKEGKVTIEGEENLMEYVLTEVSGGNLKIKVKKGVNLKTSRRLVVTVPVEDIEKVSLGGSGNIECDFTLKATDFDVNLGGSGNIELKVAAENLKLSIGGSGNIMLSGKADYMKAAIAGSGTIKAYDLEVNSLKASIAGSGNIRVTAKNEIKATVAGSGSVYYKGNPPKIKTTSVGSGTVRARN